MTFAPYRTALAFVTSVLLHLGILFGALILPAPPPPPPSPPLQAQLRPPIPTPVPEPIEIPQPSAEVTPPAPPTPPKPPPQPPKPKERPLSWQAAAKQQLKKLNDQGLLYSTEAISAGLEGTAAVLLILDEAGKVTATRIEESSGHALLDRDARNAAMRLRFPPDAPGELVLPIRFQLN